MTIIHIPFSVLLASKDRGLQMFFAMMTAACLGFCFQAMSQESVVAPSGKAITEGSILEVEDNEKDFLAGVEACRWDYLGYDDVYYYRKSKVMGDAKAPSIQVAKIKNDTINQAKLEKSILSQKDENKSQPPVYDVLLKWLTEKKLKSGLPETPPTPKP